jgi:ABC-type sugar transport system ATPase subunit
MAFALKIVGKFKDEIDVATKHAADKKQLTKYLDRLPKVLSGGAASARSHRTLNRSRPKGLSV